VAALATGAVGAFALTRSDVSDTLPGVAIAISLVPPLAVVGLTLESGSPEEAAGALLLFLTNVSAILASGVVIMAAYRVFEHRTEASVRRAGGSRGAIFAIAGLVLVVMVPLAGTSARLASETLDENAVRETATAWALASRWEIASVGSSGDTVVLRATGPLPEPDPAALRAALDAEGLGDVSVAVEMVPGTYAVLPGE
jgi:uncharacterized membrane protein